MEYLTFHVGEREFAVDLGRVREILNPPPITRVPGMPPALLGLFGLRGEPTAAVDAGLRLAGRPVRRWARSPLIVLTVQLQDRPTSVGLLVEAAGRKLELESLLPWDDALARFAGADACIGFADVDRRLVIVLDVDQLLAFERIAAAAVTALPPAAVAPGAPAQPASAPHAPPVVRAELRDPPPTTPTPPVPAPRAPAGSTESASALHAPPVVRTELRDRHPPTPPPVPAPRAPAGSASAPRAPPALRASPEASSPFRPDPSLAKGPAPRALRVSPPAELSFPLPSPVAQAPRALPPAPPAAGFGDARRKRGSFGTVAAGVAIVLALMATAYLLAAGGGRRRDTPERRSASPSREAPATAEAAPALPSRSVIDAPPTRPPSTEPPPPEPPPVARPTRETTPPPAPAPVATAPLPAPPQAPRRAHPLPPSMIVTPETPPCEIHEVRRGDTLWHISAEKLGNPYRWPQLFGENRDHLADPDVIEIHDVIRIPGACSNAPAR